MIRTDMPSLISKASILFFLAASFFVTAQDIGDLSKVNVDNLSDQQISAYIKKAEDSGLTQQQLELLARQRGMSSSQVSKLRQRILKIQSGASSSEGVIAREDRLRGDLGSNDQINYFDDLILTDTLSGSELPIFGSSIFENALTFQAPTNISTPQNYILGPGDEVIIDIYGASEITYQETISPDGKILISGVGPISLSGISVKSAKQRIFNRLSTIYSGLKGTSPNTYLDFSVGEIRTIIVNVVGNVKRPGTYSLSSFSSAFNALFEAGGPNENGTMRTIEIVRNGEQIATLDIYKYFFEGDVSGNPQLQDGDVVVVKAYNNRVKYIGEVKQPAIYEFVEDESFADLLRFSGGSNASGFDESITLFRVKGLNKSLLTFDESGYGSTALMDGDSIYIPRVSETFKNRVKIEGAVVQPGFYELKEEMKLSELLKLANLSRDAYLKRGNVISLNKDLTLVNTTFSIIDVVNGSKDITLKNEDLVRIPSILEIEERRTVSIVGEVSNEGEYPFIDGMTIEDLLAISGGLRLSANTSSVEVARRVSKNAKEFRTAIIYNYPVSEDLGLDSASTFKLEPFDLVTVKASSLFRTQKMVKIEGEVLRPGFYALESEEDKLTDLLRRAGGLTAYAYPAGASLIRDLDPNAGKSKEDQELETTSTDEGDYYRRKQLQGLIKRDSVDQLNSDLERKESVGIEFEKAIQKPNSKFNLILQDGDVLSIPKQLQTVRVRGQVLYPTRVSYDNASSFKDYISLAGGFSDNARIRKSYIVYANGRAERTKKFLFFKSFPKVEPGADIFIPERPERKKLSVQEVLGITSSLATIALIIDRLSN